MAVDPDLGRRYRLRLTKTLDAWTLARRAHEAGRRSSPAFAILDLEPRVATREPSRRRIDPVHRARQRDRYKGAMADALDAFARPHLRVDPRHRLYRPRWLDHATDCRAGLGEGRRCLASCGKIPLPPAPRWRRGRHRRKRDHLTVAEWLLDRAQAARECQDVIGLRDDRCGGIVVIPQSCHVRTCPDCESARQARIVGKYLTAAAALDPDRTRFLTTTVLNPPRDRLAPSMDKLYRDRVRLTRRALWKGGRCRPGPCRQCGARKREHLAAQHPWQPVCRQPADPSRPGWQLPHDPVTAALSHLETTYNPATRTWHPHLHSLLESPWLDQGELSDTWRAITADSEVVWIESLRARADERHAGNMEATVREVLKYSAKPQPAYLSQRDPAVVAELLVALRGRRTVTTSGKLHGIGLEAEEAEERDLVLVWPDTDQARPYHAPRLCPHHDGEAAWRVLAGQRLRRRDCTAAPDRSRPGRSILTHPPPS